MQGPNLFDHARSELAQDAFLAWLLRWADPQLEKVNAALYGAGNDFLELLLQLSGVSASTSRGPVEVKTQERSIDVLVKVGDDLVILIEDKVDAGVHGDQLARYKKWAEDRYAGRTVVPVLLSVGEHSSLQVAEDAGWAVLRRGVLLDLLRRHGPKTTNEIFHNFLTHLERVDAAVASYSTTRPVEWSWRAWTGFYQVLQQHLNGASWEYVHTGDYLALSWGWWPVPGGHVYLQLQPSELALRVQVEDGADWREVRDRLMAAFTGPEAADGLLRPRKPGKGKTMAVAVLPDYRRTRSDGLIDMEATVNLLKRTEQLVADLLPGRAA